MKTSHRVFIIIDVHVCALNTKKIIKLKNFTLFFWGGGVDTLEIKMIFIT